MGRRRRWRCCRRRQRRGRGRYGCWCLCWRWRGGRCGSRRLGGRGTSGRGRRRGRGIIWRSTLRSGIVVRGCGVPGACGRRVHGWIIRLRWRRDRRVKGHNEGLGVGDHSACSWDGTCSSRGTGRWRRRHGRIAGVCGRGDGLADQLARVRELRLSKTMFRTIMESAYEVVTNTFCVCDHHEGVYLVSRSHLITLRYDHGRRRFL